MASKTPGSRFPRFLPNMNKPMTYKYRGITPQKGEGRGKVSNMAGSCHTLHRGFSNFGVRQTLLETC